jgi:hypothetical protein
VTRSRYILFKRLSIDVKMGRNCRNRVRLRTLGVGINPLKHGSPNWDNSIEKISSAYYFSDNSARNACWCSLASLLSLYLVMELGRSGGKTHDYRKVCKRMDYRYSTSPGGFRVIVFMFSQGKHYGIDDREW